MRKKSRLCISLFLALLVFNLFSANLSANRPLGKRIQSVYDFNEDSFVVTIDSYLLTYHYASENTSFVDSISIHNEYTIAYEPTVISDMVFTFDRTVEIIDNNTNIEYLMFRDHSLQPERKYFYSFSPNGSVSEYRNYYYNDNGNISHWGKSQYSYTSSGKVDSIYSESNYSSYIYRSYRLFNYDNNNMLLSVEYYNYEDEEWALNSRYLLSYADDVIPFANPLRIFEYTNNSVISSINGLLSLTDLNYPPQTIIYQNRVAGEWVNSITTYNPHFSGSFFVISSSTNEMYGSSFSYYFNPNGYYTGSSSSGGGGESSGYSSVNFEDYVSNNDDNQQTPTTHLLISTYPNPFNTNLNIKIDSKAPASSDISIYNIKGQLIKSWKGIKSNELNWDGRDKDNKPVKSGVYLIKAKQGNKYMTMKVIKL